MRTLFSRRRNRSSGVDALNARAERMHHGFPAVDTKFLAERQGRSASIQRFLAIMAQAGNPGLHRYLGSTVRQITGQHDEHYWSTVLTDRHGHRREFLVFDDGRHGWSDEIAYSDRPRDRDDEIPAPMLDQALGAVLAEHGLSWDSPAAPWLRAVQPASPAQQRAAALTPLQELHRRELRYGALMGIRVVFLLLAAIVVILDIPNVGLWTVGFIAAAMLLPWVAVMVANERFGTRRGGP